MKEGGGGGRMRKTTTERAYGRGNCFCWGSLVIRTRSRACKTGRPK